MISGKTSKPNKQPDKYAYEGLTGYFEKFNGYTSNQAKLLFQKNNNISSLILALRMLFMPAYEFKKIFLFKLGFLGGTPVYIMSIMLGLGKFVEIAKYWEMKQKSK